LPSALALPGSPGGLASRFRHLQWVEAALKLAKDKFSTAFDAVALECRKLHGTGLAFPTLKSALIAESYSYLSVLGTRSGTHFFGQKCLKIAPRCQTSEPLSGDHQFDHHVPLTARAARLHRRFIALRWVKQTDRYWQKGDVMRCLLMTLSGHHASSTVPGTRTSSPSASISFELVPCAQTQNGVLAGLSETKCAADSDMEMVIEFGF
jgi:hypothetical protein